MIQKIIVERCCSLSMICHRKERNLHNEGRDKAKESAEKLNEDVVQLLSLLEVGQCINYHEDTFVFHDPAYDPRSTEVSNVQRAVLCVYGPYK